MSRPLAGQAKTMQSVLGLSSPCVASSSFERRTASTATASTTTRHLSTHSLTNIVRCFAGLQKHESKRLIFGASTIATKVRTDEPAKLIYGRFNSRYIDGRSFAI